MDLSRSLQHQGFTVRYKLCEPDTRAVGVLKTVVFVHGTPWNSVVFHPLAKALLATGRYRVLLYDLPGYGNSQHFNSHSQTQDETNLFKGDTSVRAQAETLVALLKETQLHSNSNTTAPAPAVIAHDIAGAVVLRAHLLHNTDFSCLTLLDTNTVLPWGDGFYKLARSQPQVFIDMPLHIHEAIVRAVTRSASHSPKSFPKSWEDALVEPWVVSEQAQRNFVRQIAQANDGDVAEMLDADMYGQVRCDVKILWGEQDQWIPREKMDQLAGMLGERLREFVVVSGAGHLIMIDQPERVAVEILTWLGRY